MDMNNKFLLTISFIVLLLMANLVNAGQAEILDAKAIRSGDGWRFTVSVEHADSGWEHYADSWRVVTEDGDLLGERTLMHPHEGEQPFTRSLDGVNIPKNINVVYIEAHDSVHGWSSQRVKVILRGD